MAILDFALNCACLLLWLNWRSRGLANLPRSPGIALIGLLKRAERGPAERWPSILILPVVLLLRAILYYKIGPSVHWLPSMSLGPIALHFRSDMISRMLLFSLLGFILFLAAFYFSLLLIAAVNSRMATNNPWLALVHAHLGPLARLPAWLKLLAPFLITFLLWLAMASLFGTLGLAVAWKSSRQLVYQAALIGLSACLLWQYVVGAVLVLYILSSYVYLGAAPFWNFINGTAHGLLRPLVRLPLRVGKIDLAPFLALGLLALIIIFALRGLASLYARLGV